ncbi:MAG: signal recognition particle-docking protein FtsY [Nitrospinae bacterium]|nr:signal recognition particle-docking protein FtsY [Nitrospinota bacterium]
MADAKEGLFTRLRKGLAKTHDALVGKIAAVTGRMHLDDALLEELEYALIAADTGMPTTMELINQLKAAVKNKELTSVEGVRPFLARRIQTMMTVPPIGTSGAKPHVILMIGVNGAGKTTTIGKLAALFAAGGKRVLLAAGDTFRAAAIEQLAEWGKRTGAELVRHEAGGDPSAVAFDAMKAGIARGADIIIIDTAGRLHTRNNLMEEMKKIRRVIGRELPGAPHETLLVVDGATGQNAINQVKEFNQSVPLTGIVITKLDGTSKGGAVIGIVNETKIPVRYIGVGESVEDLQPFDPALFSEALLQ